MFLSNGTALSMSLQVLFLSSLITLSGLVAAISLSVSIYNNNNNNNNNNKIVNGLNPGVIS